MENHRIFNARVEKIGLLSSMFTDLDYRRKGIARELLSRVIKRCQRIWLRYRSDYWRPTWGKAVYRLRFHYTTVILCSIL